MTHRSLPEQLLEYYSAFGDTGNWLPESPAGTGSDITEQWAVRQDKQEAVTQMILGDKMLLLLLLLSAPELLLAAGDHHGAHHGVHPGVHPGVQRGALHGVLMPGSPINISENDAGLQGVLLNATYTFNNQTNDAFLFRTSAIRRAQRQVVKGIRYIVDFDISRTVCRKRDNTDVLSCSFQPVGRLQQTFRCHLEVWLIPWLKRSSAQELHCKP